ncbi:MAG: hypothetical protein MR700_00860 [Selenomonadaceae bacterium]|nr:hypothetical protein [Selenomonadaceae bacterium]
MKAIPSINTDHVIGTDSVNIAQSQGFANAQYFQFIVVKVRDFWNING